MQRDLVRFPADVLIRFQHRSNDGIPDRRPIVLFISNYRSSCPNRDSSRPLQDLQEQGTKTTFLLMPIWNVNNSVYTTPRGLFRSSVDAVDSFFRDRNQQDQCSWSKARARSRRKRRPFRERGRRTSKGSAGCR